jgi:uncharacterized membrane protein YsdA (DUF1294 family)/cold shock CspA family protein
MRHRGRITNWKDDQGFGFVTPSVGGSQVFVHIKSFSNRQRRPVGGELVTYERKTDSIGRLRGENVAFVGDRTVQSSSPGPGIGSFTFTALFLIFVVGEVSTGELPLAVLGLYLVASVIAFLAYALDKSAAQKGAWRTSESTLHLFALVGGWPGALVAQKVLRHKSKKQEFQMVFWVTVILNCGALGWFFSSSGASELGSVLDAVSELING